MLKAIAIDDEPIALDVIKSLIDKVTFVDVLRYFTDAFEALEFMKHNQIDLIFLDIMMPDITGFEFIKTLPIPPMIIFTTAYSEHAVQGFEMDAVDYLLKPFSLTRFLKACNKAYERQALNTQMLAKPNVESHMFVKSGLENVRIAFEEILYAEALGNYVQLVLENKKIVTRLTMTEVETLLNSNGFVRIHRSFIVSKKNIQKFDKKSVWINQTELPIGPIYLSSLEQTIFNLK